MGESYDVRICKKNTIALLRAAVSAASAWASYPQRAHIYEGFHGESDEGRFRMQVRASLGFAAFVLARRKLPAVRRFDLPITAHALQLYRSLHQSVCQQEKFEWQTPLTMDSFLLVLLT